MATTNYVICVQCGKRYDANRSGSYDPYSRQYTCKACGKVQKAAAREKSTGMRQSTGAMIAKIAFGVLFVLTGFSSPEEGWTVSYFLTSLVIGGALIAWGLLPYLKARKQKIAEEQAAKEVVAGRLNEVKTCSSCGATGTGARCEYCGSKYSK